MIAWPAAQYWTREIPGLCGRSDLSLGGVSAITTPSDKTLMFASRMSQEMFDKLLCREGCLIIANETDRAICRDLESKHGVLYCDDPRYRFAELLQPLWSIRSLRGELTCRDSGGLSIGARVSIAQTATIEPNVTIGNDSVVGPDVYVMAGVRIGPDVHIGAGSAIRENAVIGGWGFGFARSVGKPTLRIPHVGGVVIGENVEIGALATVCSGTIDPTLIEDNVKIDDHVHIAHNCRICEDVIVTACAEISGGVTIGPATWLGPNCSVIDRISIGAGSMVGIGAVVTKPVGDGLTVVGNPAQSLRERAAERRSSRPRAGRQ